MSRYEAEKRYLRKDGGVLWVHVIATAISDAAGVFRFSAGVIEDVTERKTAADALKQLNALLERQVADRTKAVRECERVSAPS